MPAPIFYPGYYPGKRPLKKRGGRPVPPNPDLVMEAINQTIDFDSAALGLPKKLSDLYEGDFEDALNLRYKVEFPSGLSSEDLTKRREELQREGGFTFEESERVATEEEYSELPGAIGIGLNLDPEQWKEKGADAMIQNTAKAWVNAALGFKDLTIKAELSGVWDPLLNPYRTDTKEQQALSLHSSDYVSSYGEEFPDLVPKSKEDFSYVDRYSDSIRNFIAAGSSAPARRGQLAKVKENFARSLKQVINSNDPNISEETKEKVEKLNKEIDEALALEGKEKEKKINELWKDAIETREISDITVEAARDKKIVAWARLVNFRDEVFRYNEYIDAAAEGNLIKTFIWTKLIKQRLPFLTAQNNILELIKDPVRFAIMRYAALGKDAPILGKVMGKIGANLDKVLGGLADVIAKRASGVINLVSGGFIKRAATGVTEWVLGAAGVSGIGTLPAITAAVLTFLGEKLWNLTTSLFKLEFDKAYEKLVKEFTNLAKVAMVVPLIFAGFVFIVYLIITPILASVAGTTGTKAGGEGAGPGGMAGEIETNPNCGVKDGSIPLSPSSSSSIVTRAYSIVLGLIPGFWCFWNHYPSPPYDKFWDAGRYATEPFPPADVSGLNIFWCTYLVVYSYKEVGIPIAGISEIANTQNMAVFFGYNIVDYRYDFLGRPKIKNGVSKADPRFKFYANVPGVVVRPGDAIFFKTPGRAYGRLAHVAVVHSVSSEGIETIHSNASAKRWFFPYKYAFDPVANSIQAVVDDNKYMEVWGFGRYEP